MPKLTILLATLLSLSATAAVEIKKISCADEPGFVDTWNQLADQEQEIDWVVYKIAQRAGIKPEPVTSKYSYARFTNCVVEYPQDGGKTVDGVRRVDIDMQWFSHDSNGRQVFQQDGLLVEYRLDSTQTPALKTLVSLVVCRTPDSCTRLGIPFQTPPSR